MYTDDQDVQLAKFYKACPRCGTANWAAAPDFFSEKGVHDQDYYVRCRNCKNPILFWKQDISEESDE